MPDLNEFAGRPPYASELLGVFHPLLGWRGRSGRVLQRKAVVQRVTALAGQYASAASEPAGSASLPAEARSGNAVIDELAAQVAVRHPGKTELTPEEWRATLTPEAIQSAVQNAIALLPSSDPATGAANLGAILQTYYQGSGSVVEMMVSQQPGALNGLLFAPASELALHALSRFPRLADAIISPIGLLHLFRQYFFELDSFLGPPVGHVWVSPGSTLELVESTVRRRLVEKYIESLLEVTTRSETSSETKEELSEAVKQENADDMRLAVSASGGFNVGVAQGQASASFHLDQARRTAVEQTHKRTRSQTEKKSTEIRQSFKTTFRTVSEQTDTTSKRYVLQNNTDQLINYELRRKMRRVGVQLQHLGTRLCWQYYIDGHASGLRISRLVHLARLSDDDMGLRPPEAPPKPEPYSEEYVATLPFHPQQHENIHWDEDYLDGKAQGGKACVWQWEFARAPKPGYELQSGAYAGMLPQGDLGGSPYVNVPPQVEVDPSPGPPPARSQGKFKISLRHVNWKSAQGIRVKINLQFGPSQAALSDMNTEFTARKKDFQEQRRRTYQEAFVQAVRDRIKVAGEVHPRPFDDLREEERHCIYRRLIDKLTHGGTAMGSDSEAKHTTAEIVRQLFDVDAILYFVAPDWWDPAARQRANLNVVTPKPPSPDVGDLGLRPGDQLDWGYHPNSVGDPYLLTEESRPAPMGASIGWILQLDGDRMRNAFLNAAWAKVVVPMRPGREREAIAWLRDQAEQDVGLKTPYQLQPDDPQSWAGKTLEEVLDILIADIQKEHEQANTVDPNDKALPGERVFENGFDPLAGGVRFDAQAMEVFDQWVEALPTDQVVAVKYEPKT